MFAVTESKKSILDGPGEAEGSRDEMMAVSHRKKTTDKEMNDDTGRGKGNTLGFFLGGGRVEKGKKNETRRNKNERWRLSYARSRLTARVIFIPYSLLNI